MLRVGGGASVVQLKNSEMGGLEPAPSEATAAFTHTTVTSDTPVNVATNVTAALPTPAAKRRPWRPKGSKKTNKQSRTAGVSRTEARGGMRQTLQC